MCSSWPAKTEAGGAVLLGALVAAALGLRLWGIGFGLPLVSNFYIRPDETLLVVPAAELFARHGDPGHLNYPAFLIELLALLFRCVHGILAGLGAARASFLDDFRSNPSRYFLAARILSATCGAATTLVVHRLARRWCPPALAFLAAAWYAAAPLAVREAHYAVTDTLLAFLVAATLLATCRWLEAPAAGRRPALLVCGCIAGAAMATKYHAVILLPAIALALWLDRDRPAGPKDLLLFTASAIATFLLLNPWLWLRAGELLESVQVLYRSVYQSGAGAPPGRAWWHQPGRALVLPGFMPGRWIGLLLALVGLGASLARVRSSRDGRLAALLAVALGFVALLLPARTVPFRYLCPILPLAALLAGIGLAALGKRFPVLRTTGALAFVGVLGLAMTLPVTLRMDRSLAMKDTRSEAGRWIEENVPPGMPIVWLGEPESEPQWNESASSLRRRIAYVERRYGRAAARIIDRIYRLRMEAEPGGTREVFRNPAPGEVPPGAICVIQAQYPLPMVPADPRLRAVWTQGGVLREHHVGAPLGRGRHVLDKSDAWFLPMNLSEARQPGPMIHIYLVRPAPSPPS